MGLSVDTVSIFTFVTAIIVGGFAGELFFKKTGVPMFVFLILMSIIIGPVLNLLPRTALLPSLGVFAELTLLMVLFYGGIDTRLDASEEVIRGPVAFAVCRKPPLSLDSLR